MMHSWPGLHEYLRTGDTASMTVDHLSTVTGNDNLSLLPRGTWMVTITFQDERLLHC